MVTPYLMVRSPDKINIKFSVQKVGSHESVCDLKAMRTLLPRVIILCRHKADCGKIYTFFRVNMGNEFTDPPGTSIFYQNIEW